MALYLVPQFYLTNPCVCVSVPVPRCLGHHGSEVQFEVRHSSSTVLSVLARFGRLSCFLMNARFASSSSVMDIIVILIAIASNL